MNAYKAVDQEKKVFPTDVVGSMFPLAFGIKTVEMTLQPGGKIPPHTTTDNVLFYVIEGTVIATASGEDKEVSAGTLIEVPGTGDHGMFNNTDSVAKVLVIKQKMQ